MAKKQKNAFILIKYQIFSLFLLFLALEAYGLEASFVINNNATYTNSKIVVLNVNADSSLQCRFANQMQPYSNYTNCTPSVSWTLLAGGGLRVVYMQVTDGVETLTLEDSIILDATPPMASLVINSNATTTESQDVILTLAFSDNLAGINSCRLSNGNNIWTEWEICENEKPWTLSSGNGIKRVYLQVMDNAGNIKQVFDEIMLGQCYDNDNDGYTTCQNDCNDSNPAINPSAVEVCNLFDDNCNGLVNEGLICNGSCVSNIVCGSWGECVNGIQYRTCHDNNSCIADYQENQSCSIERRSGGGGGKVYSGQVVVENKTIEEYIPEWECKFSECINGTSIKTCYELRNASNVYTTSFSCKSASSVAEKDVAEEFTNKTGYEGNKIVQASENTYLKYLLYVFAAFLILAIIFTVYVFSYENILINKRSKIISKELDEKVRRLLK